MIDSLHLLVILLVVQTRMQLAVFTVNAHCWFMLSFLSANTPGPFSKATSLSNALACIAAEDTSFLGAGSHTSASSVSAVIKSTILQAHVFIVQPFTTNTVIEALLFTFDIP